jgi:hypothetical protein
MEEHFSYHSRLPLIRLVTTDKELPYTENAVGPDRLRQNPSLDWEGRSALTCNMSQFAENRAVVPFKFE